MLAVLVSALVSMMDAITDAICKEEDKLQYAILRILSRALIAIGVLILIILT